MGKVHGSLARAGKVKSQTPKVEKQESAYHGSLPLDAGRVGRRLGNEAAVRGRNGRLIWTLLSFCLLFLLATLNLDGLSSTLPLSYYFDDPGISKWNLPERTINQLMTNKSALPTIHYHLLTQLLSGSPYQLLEPYYYYHNHS
jgi:hypothetical protein